MTRQILAGEGREPGWLERAAEALGSDSRYMVDAWRFFGGVIAEDAAYSHFQSFVA